MTAPDDADPGPLVETPQGEVSEGFLERTFHDSLDGATITKGGTDETSPEAMAALRRGGVAEWRRHLGKD